MSEGARELLKANNIPFDEHVSKRFTNDLHKDFSQVIALDKNIFDDAKKISGGDPNKKIRLFKDINGKDFSVDDPFVTRNYQRAYKEIYRSCELLLSELISEKDTAKNFVEGFEGVSHSVNDTPYKRIIAIGDVHSSLTRLGRVGKV